MFSLAAFLSFFLARIAEGRDSIKTAQFGFVCSKNICFGWPEMTTSAVTGTQLGIGMKYGACSPYFSFIFITDFMLITEEQDADPR